MTRDTWLICGALIVALLLGVGLYFFNASDAIAPFLHSSSGTRVEVLAEGTTSNVSDRKNYKIINKEQLAEIWGMAYGDNAPAIPSVDFSKKQVLAVFAGNQPSQGYTISVPSVTDSADARVVSIVLSEPGKECPVLSATTNPFVLVVVPISTLSIQKDESTTTAPCKN